MPRIKDIHLQSKGNSQIMSAGKPVKIFKFQSQQGVNQNNIKKQIKELQRQNPNLKNYSIAIDLDFREAGWRSSYFQPFNTNYDDFKLFNIFDYYDEGDEIEQAFLQKIDIDNFDDYKYKKFNIYLKYNGDDKGGSDDKNNHCLYRCLLKACPIKTRYFWKKPSYLKMFCEVEFNDKIPIKCIPKIEEHANISIRVEGDYLYEPKKMKTTHIDLLLKEGHYHLKRDSHMKIQKLVEFCRKKRYILVVVGESEYFDGEERENRYDENGKDKVYGTNSISKNWFLYTAKTENLENEYEIAKEKLNTLKDKTDIDLLEFGNISSASLHSFNQLCIKENGYGSSPEKLTQMEANWIEKATIGGIMYAKEKTSCDKAYCYDVNSLYPYTLLNMNIPASQGKFIKMNEIPKVIDYLFIVKAEIEKGHKLFRYNENNLYTSYDLQNAKTLKLDINLIDDDINCLTYKNSRILKGKVFFKPFIDYWYEMKKEGIPYSKLIMNSLWGALVSLDKRQKPERTNDNEFPYKVPNGYDLRKMTFKGFSFHYKYEFVNQLQRFRYTYARLKPFLLAKAKNKILSSSINYHIKNDNILYSHTDSLITKNPLTFKLSDKIGSWKLEKEGKIYIKNLTNKSWF